MLVPVVRCFSQDCGEKVCDQFAMVLAHQQPSHSSSHEDGSGSPGGGGAVHEEQEDIHDFLEWLSYQEECLRQMAVHQTELK